MTMFGWFDPWPKFQDRVTRRKAADADRLERDNRRLREELRKVKAAQRPEKD